MSHTVGAAIANYVWDVNRSVPEILQDGTNTYVYGLDLISSTDSSGNQTFYTTDGLGSTTDLTNSSAAITDQYSYDVFGAVRSHTGTSSNYWQFTGEQTDASSGLQYLRARYYDPGTGRFLSQDPLVGSLASPITQNRYAYAAGNPVRWVDPRGTCLGLGDCGPVDDAGDALGDAGGAIIDTGKNVVSTTADFISGFVTLDCLDFGVGASLTIAGLVAPEFLPGLTAGAYLLDLSLIESNQIAFAVFTGVSASQIDHKEGGSLDNVLNGASIVASGSAVLADTLHYIPNLTRAQSRTLFAFNVLATGISGVQCVKGGLGY